jgi:uncharacterized protein (DUF1501 family)
MDISGKTRTGIARRDLLRAGFGAVALGGGQALGLAPLFASSAAAQTRNANRILVVVELSGGNDGLNTIVPYGDDAYYKARPRIGIKPKDVRKIDDHFGFQNTMSGFERLYKDGHMAIVHGAGYPQPSFSHFSSMAYWHTAAPNRGAPYGWMGTLADRMDPERRDNFLVNIDTNQSLAVLSRNHVPLVFDDPARFARATFADQSQALEAVLHRKDADTAASQFMIDISRSAVQSERLVREAWNNFRTPVDYGLVRFGLDKVAALIAADFPTRLFYLAYRHNAFDTHVYQSDVHARLWTYTADHIAAFMADMQRMGRADDVVLMAFSEFGRRVQENTSQGTDHGTAGPAFIAGKPVRGGQFGKPPSLTDLDDGNLIHTTDYRRIYATLMRDWLGVADTRDILGGDFESLRVFG